MKKNKSGICLIQVIKESKNCLFLLIIIQKVIIKVLLALLKNILENYNIRIYGRDFCDQSINDSIKQQDEVRKKSAEQGDDYTTGCLLDFAYF